MRRTPRLALQVPVTLTGWGVTARAALANLSLNGAFIQGWGMTEAAPLVNLRFSMPPAGLALDVLGRVIHISTGGFGAELLDLRAEGREELWRAMAPRFDSRFPTCLFCHYSLSSRGEVCPRCGRCLNLEGHGYEEVWELSEPLAPPGLLGESPVMQAVFQAVRRLSTTDEVVLLTGPPGCGKEAVARAIHALSRRRSRPFLVISCGALREWRDSELFQPAADPFTRYSRYDADPLRLALGGTLYLEEVGCLPLEKQAGLVHFIQKQGKVPLTGGLTAPWEVRLLAASCRPLTELVQMGRCRKDLACYLSGAHVDLPPLRERGDDVLIMAMALVKQIVGRVGNGVLGLAWESAQVLRSYGWPGNLDELHNRVERAVAVSEGSWVTPQDLGLPPAAVKPALLSPELSLAGARARFEKELVAETLERWEGNLRLAAQALEISVAALKRLVRKYDLHEVELSQGQWERGRGPPG